MESLASSLDTVITFFGINITMFIGLWVIFLQQKDELMEAEVHIGRVLLDTLSGAG